VILWRHARRQHLRWSSRLIVGTVLIGFGVFNLVEGLANHHLLGLHHVNETVPREQWIVWDVGFLAWGALMVVIGWTLKRSGRTATARAAEQERRRQPAVPRAGGRRHYDPPAGRPA
jgi:uncharacterized membrane protein